MNRKKLNVLIVQNSRVITERLTLIIEDLPGVRDVFYASAIDKATNLLVFENIDIIIWGVPFTDGIIDTLAEIRKTIKPLFFIVLSHYTEQDYRKRFSRITADVFLNKLTDFDKIPELINNKSIPGAAKQIGNDYIS